MSKYALIKALSPLTLPIPSMQKEAILTSNTYKIKGYVKGEGKKVVTKVTSKVCRGSSTTQYKFRKLSRVLGDSTHLIEE